MKYEVHVVKHMAKQMILGIDFLEKHKVKLDFEKKTLAVGKEIILLQAGKAVIHSDCALVLTKEKHLIQPLSSGMIAVNLGLQRKQRKGTYLLSPLDNSPLLQDEPGLLLPPTLVKGKRTALVPYINETTKTFPIPKGQVVGLVEKVDKKHISEISSHSSKEQTLVEQTDFNKDVSYVPQSHREALSVLLKRFEHIFAHSEVDLGHTDLVKMKLDTASTY